MGNIFPLTPFRVAAFLSGFFVRILSPPDFVPADFVYKIMNETIETLSFWLLNARYYTDVSNVT